MFFRFKTVLIFISLFSFAAAANAAWWDTKSLPVPADTKEVKKETRAIGNQELFFTYYVSNQDAEQIKNFYRNRLVLEGWKEKDLTQNLNQIQVPGLDKESMKKVLETNLFFENDTDTLILNFMPAQFSQEGKTKFTLCQTKKTSTIQLSPDTVPVPALLTKPKKDVAPVYPGASLINLAEDSRSLKATYFSKDDIEPVISFYKNKMPDYGWDLAKEAPLKKMDAGSCPSCPKNLVISSQSAEVWIAEMDFTNQRGDVCKLGLSEVITAYAATSKTINITTISVSYDEKRE